jgi:DNA mismatch endonuclease (patch repair protein)
MAAQLRRDTKPEMALRQELHRSGLRYRVDYQVLKGLRRRADVAFPRAQVAVFVDGCFWHGCPTHRTWPKSNSEWWASKLEANVSRDRDTDRRLAEAGWLVIRVWEHEDSIEAAATIKLRLEQLRGPRLMKTLFGSST